MKQIFKFSSELSIFLYWSFTHHLIHHFVSDYFDLVPKASPKTFCLVFLDLDIDQRIEFQILFDNYLTSVLSSTHNLKSHKSKL